MTVYWGHSRDDMACRYDTAAMTLSGNVVMCRESLGVAYTRAVEVAES